MRFLALSQATPVLASPISGVWALLIAASVSGCGTASRTAPSVHLPRSVTQSPSSAPASQAQLSRAAPAGVPDEEPAPSGPEAEPKPMVVDLGRVMDGGSLQRSMPAIPLRRSVSASVVERRLRNLVARRARVYWPDRTASGVRCVEWQFGQRDDLVLSRRYGEGDAVVRESYGVTLHKNIISLSGPATQTEGTREVRAALCISEFLVVDIAKDRILMLRGAKEVDEYRPEAVEVWFVSRAACERGAARANWGGCCGE